MAQVVPNLRFFSQRISPKATRKWFTGRGSVCLVVSSWLMQSALGNHQSPPATLCYALWVNKSGIFGGPWPSEVYLTAPLVATSSHVFAATRNSMIMNPATNCQDKLPGGNLQGISYKCRPGCTSPHLAHGFLPIVAVTKNEHAHTHTRIYIIYNIYIYVI